MARAGTSGELSADAAARMHVEMATWALMLHRVCLIGVDLTPPDAWRRVTVTLAALRDEAWGA